MQNYVLHTQRKESLCAELCIVHPEEKSLCAELCIVHPEEKSLCAELCIVHPEEKSMCAELCIAHHTKIREHSFFYICYFHKVLHIS